MGEKSLEESYRILQTGAGWFRPVGESVIRLTGADVDEWLQGQATNDVSNVAHGSSVEFCLCTPTGQIIAACAGWKREDAWIIVSGAGGAVMERVSQMVIMEDVSAEDLTVSVSLVSVQGASASVSGGFRHDRSGFAGFDVLDGPPAGVRQLSADAVKIAALEAGLPEFGVDYGPKTFPAELGSVFESRNVSYRKGCYTGQEVLMRIHSRGHTNKTWCGLLLEAEVPVGPYDFGSVTHCLHSPDHGWIAGAMLSNDYVKEGLALKVGDKQAEVRLMPLRR